MIYLIRRHQNISNFIQDLKGEVLDKPEYLGYFINRAIVHNLIINSK